MQLTEEEIKSLAMYDLWRSLREVRSLLADELDEDMQRLITALLNKM
jgi:hypothetical protein